MLWRGRVADRKARRTAQAWRKVSARGRVGRRSGAPRGIRGARAENWVQAGLVDWTRGSDRRVAKTLGLAIDDAEGSCRVGRRSGVRGLHAAVFRERVGAGGECGRVRISSRTC